MDERTNDAACAANSLYASLGARCGGLASDAQSAVLTDMIVVADTGTPPLLHEQEALREPLHQDARYNDDVVVSAGSFAVFGGAVVSLSADASCSPAVTSLLPEDKADVFKCFRGRMLLSEAERLESGARR